MSKKKIITAIAAIGLVSLTGVGVVTRINASINVHSHVKDPRHHISDHDNHVYIIQVTKKDTFAYSKPSTKYKRGCIYLPKSARLHVYNTVKKHNQTFYEIKSHRYVKATDVKVIE